MSVALDTYFEQLYARLDAFGDAGALAQIRTVYVGGGTPSLAGERLVEFARRISAWCKPVEFTCEANPESLTAELATALAGVGVTRVSLGVQTLDNAELTAIGRIHDADRALAAITTVKDAGLVVSCDLMCGLPGQTDLSWQRTLDGVLAAAPHHVSVYPLTLEEGTPLYRVACRDESLEPDLLANPPEACKKLAERKAGAVVQEILADPAFEGMLIVIGSDTMVVKDGDIFGKPKSASDATHMLRRLSGATHEVITAVSVWMVSAEAVDPALAADDSSGNISLGFRTFCDTSRVTFHELTDERIREYLACGESFDKAGAYAVQGEGAKLVKHIDGYKSTVIGLPVERLVKEFPDLV